MILVYAISGTTYVISAGLCNMFERVLAAVAPRKTLSEEQLEGHKRKRRNGEPGTNWEEDGPSSDADVDDGPWLDLEASREIALFQVGCLCGCNRWTDAERLCRRRPATTW